MKSFIRIVIFLSIFCIICNILFYLIPNCIQLKQSYQLFKTKYPTIPFYSECGERLNAYHNIEETDVVLEIGGNIGSTSLIIADKLKNSSNLVVIEPSKKAVKELIKNKQKYQFNFHIYEGCLSKKPLFEKKTNILNLSYWMQYTEVTNQSKEATKIINTITFKDLETKFKLRFNTLVIDCEGCYQQIFREFPEILQQVDKILIEWDGVFLEDLLLKHNFHKISYYYHPFLWKGISTYKKIL